jgi:hypothetical protein
MVSGGGFIPSRSKNNLCFKDHEARDSVVINEQAMLAIHKANRPNTVGSLLKQLKKKPENIS